MNQPSSSDYRRPLWLAIGAALLLALGAAARNETRGARDESPDAQADSVATTSAEETVPAISARSTKAASARAGQRAFIDPATGELTANPSPQQLQRLSPAARDGLSRSFVGLEPFNLRHGGRGVNLQGRFQSALRVTADDDGTFRMTCGDHDHDHDEAPGSRTADATTQEPTVVHRASDPAPER